MTSTHLLKLLQQDAEKKAEERFFSKVNYSDDCWEWTGYRLPRGHGVFGYKKKNVVASRWSYEYFVGEIPNGYFVCHHCDNGACVNPFHLFAGSQSDNMKDCSNKGRLPAQNGKHFNSFKTHCPCGHEYNVENTKTYKGNRYCRACRRVANLKKYYKRKAAKKALQKFYAKMEGEK